MILEYDEPLSNFVFEFNLRRYTEAQGVQLVEPIAGLSEVLLKCGGGGGSGCVGGVGGGAGDCIFGTKSRAVIRHANKAGIRAVVEQQFALAAQVKPYSQNPKP